MKRLTTRTSLRFVYTQPRSFSGRPAFQIFPCAQPHDCLHLTSWCHPGAKLAARYEKQLATLSLACGVCDRTVAALEIARRERTDNGMGNGKGEAHPALHLRHRRWATSSLARRVVACPKCGSSTKAEDSFCARC